MEKESQEEKADEQDVMEEEEEASHEYEAQEEGEDLKPWQDWIQRVTRLAVEQMKKAHVEDRGVAARNATWTLAGHISRRSDGRWSTEMLDWCPEGGGRRVGQPSKRWRDDIERVSSKLLEADSAEEWRIYAESREDWKRLQERWLEELDQRDKAR